MCGFFFPGSRDSLTSRLHLFSHSRADILELGTEGLLFVQIHYAVWVFDYVKLRYSEGPDRVGSARIGWELRTIAFCAMAVYSDGQLFSHIVFINNASYLSLTSCPKHRVFMSSLSSLIISHSGISEHLPHNQLHGGGRN